jgi:hypothetical protein
MSMSKKPTTVTLFFLDDAKPDTQECLYAKARNGALEVANKEGNRFKIRYIPFSRPDLAYIEVESEKSDHDHDSDRD